MFEERDDTILARWLAGELTPEEQRAFERSPEYTTYENLARGLDRYKKPEFDKDRLKNQVWNHINASSKGNVIPLKPLYYSIAVAASLLLFIGLFFNQVTYETGTGEQLAIILPDGSEIQLNAKSKLQRNRFFWNSNKSVSLEGEGFFIIEKGQDFSVQTKAGTVSVLGTEFNVKTRTAFFELACYEGKVRFDNQKKAISETLAVGQGLRIDNKLERITIERSTPDWVDGKSTFTSTPLSEVIAELEAQYDINIMSQRINISHHFTGSFTHNDLDLALKTVFVPMGINYQLSEDQKTLTLIVP